MDKLQSTEYAKPQSERVKTKLAHKSNQIFYYIRCTMTKRETSFAQPISTSLYPGNIALFEKTSQRWRAVGNTLSIDTTGRLAD